jgi:hypothetical protein
LKRQRGRRWRATGARPGAFHARLKHCPQAYTLCG